MQDWETAANETGIFCTLPFIPERIRIAIEKKTHTGAQTKMPRRSKSRRRSSKKKRSPRFRSAEISNYIQFQATKCNLERRFDPRVQRRNCWVYYPTLFTLATSDNVTVYGLKFSEPLKWVLRWMSRGELLHPEIYRERQIALRKRNINPYRDFEVHHDKLLDFFENEECVNFRPLVIWEDKTPVRLWIKFSQPEYQRVKVFVKTQDVLFKQVNVMRE